NVKTWYNTLSYSGSKQILIKLFKGVRQLTYQARFGIFTIIDSLIVLTAIFASNYILAPTFGVFTNQTIIISAIILLVTHHIVATIFHLYDRAWGVASIRELVTIAIAVTITIII